MISIAMIPKYDTIGIGYNTTRKADPYLTEKIIQHLQPHTEGTYLEIGCGTGNYTIALQEKGFHLIGIDPSVEMLSKAQERNKDITWQQGKAESLELQDNSIDGIFGFLTIHHWSDMQRGFREISRVLKPNGKVVLFTSTPEQMRGYWLNHYFPNMLEASINQMPSLGYINESMLYANIALTATDTYAIHEELEDNFLYCGKVKPELYFFEEIRNGISSFSSLAHTNEVEQGLIHLAADIYSDTFDRVTKKYNNENDDYLFVIAQKN